MGIPGVLAKTHHLHHQSGSVHQEFAVPVANGQTIRRMDWVTMSSNAVSQAIALPGSNNSVTASGGNLAVYGVAVSDQYTLLDGSVVVDVAPVTKGLQIMLPIYNATASAAEQQDVDKQTYYQVGRYRGADASAWWYVMTTTTSNGEVRPLQYYKGDAPDTDYGRAYVQVKESLAQS